MSGFDKQYAKELRDTKKHDELFRYCTEFSDEPPAQFFQALCYLEGKGAELDLKKAVQLFLSAAEHGDYDAMNWAGFCYRYALGVEHPIGMVGFLSAKAASLLTLAARKRIELGLSDTYVLRSGISDLDLAFMLHKNAAAHGDANSMYALGYLYAEERSEPENAVYWYRKASEQGVVESMYRLGSMYRQSNAISRDPVEAFKWFQLAAENGHTDAMFELSDCYCRGIGTTKNLAIAVVWLKTLARQEGFRCHEAKILLASIYEEGGPGVEKDLHKALEWYQKAAEAGYKKGLFHLGLYYEAGLAVEQNLPKAIECYQAACPLEDAILRLSYCYEKGIGVDTDQAKAEELFNRVRNVGFLSLYGFLYNYGIDGKLADHEMAVKLFQEGACKGDEWGMVALGDCYIQGKGVAKSETLAMEWYQKAADLGNSYAMVSLGCCYYSGVGVAEDKNKAAQWFRQAANLGVAEAMTNLGECYLKGEGVAEDKTLAVQYYQEAVSLGNPDAMFSLGCCYLKGEGVARDVLKGNKLVNQAADDGCAQAREYLEKEYKSENEQQNELQQLRKELEEKNKQLESMINNRNLLREMQEIREIMEREFTKSSAALDRIEIKTDEILDTIKKTIPALLREGKDELQRQLSTINISVDESLQREELTETTLQDMTKRIDTEVQQAAGLRDMVRAEKERLAQIFGDGWLKLQEGTQTSLISAGVMLRACASIPDTEAFDYSGICISATSALEAELKKLLFADYQNYLARVFKKTGAYDGKRKELYWEHVRVGKTEVNDYYIGSVFTLGSLPYLFGLKGDLQEVQRELIAEYLHLATKKTGSYEAFNWFVQPQGNSRLSFIERCEAVRDNYRNKAAHTDIIDKQTAEACYTEVVGKSAALRDVAEVTSLLMELATILK